MSPATTSPLNVHFSLMCALVWPLQALALVSLISLSTFTFSFLFSTSEPTLMPVFLALVQLFTLSKSSTSIASYARPLGAVTVALAFAVLLIGFVRFFTIQNALTRGKFPVARATVAGMSLALAGVVVVVFAVILAVAK